MKNQRSSTAPPLLIVEDDPEIRAEMKWALASDYRVLEATDRDSALRVALKELPRLVLLDLGLPPNVDGPTEGLTALRELFGVHSGVKVIVVTGYNERANALAAIGDGAYDFIEKPIDLNLLKVVLQRAAHVSGLEEDNLRLLQQMWDSGFEGILGVSPGMRQVFDVIRRVAGSNLSVLISGESGTGKELIARAIHRRSKFRDGPFVAINCGAIPETLLESELFGHEKGAFTGADRQRQGRLEQAAGGTLFLDEVGQISLALQVKLLRFLQDGQLERVGGRTAITVQARILAASNVDLMGAMEQGRFRDDLYYRLSEVEVTVPPLRERGNDVVLLARALTRQYAGELNRRVRGCTDEAINSMRAYDWPGNVREMENRIRRTVLLAEGPRIRPADLELPGSESGETTRKLRRLKAEVEKELIENTLVSQGWNVTRAAMELDITRQTLYSMMKRYGLTKPR